MSSQESVTPGQPSSRPMSRWRSLGRGIRVLLRLVGVLIELGLLWIGGLIVLTDTNDEFGLMAAWDLLALCYLGIGFIGAWSFGTGQPEDGPASWLDHLWMRRLLGWYAGLLPVVFSLLGVTAAISVTVLPTTGDTTGSFELKLMGALAMVLAWLLLHVSYARRYRWFYEGEGGGLEFPGDAGEPTEIDFLYFALTLGSSFATSDVNVTTTRMRWHVLLHSVLGFFYNAIVLAVAFRVFTGG